MRPIFVDSLIPNDILWLIEQVRPFLRWILTSFLCTITGVLLGLLNPLILKWLIDQILPRREVAVLLVVIFLWFLSYEARTAASILGAYMTTKAAQRVRLRLRMQLLRCLNKLSADYFEKVPTGATIYPLQEPVEEIAQFGSDVLPSVLRVVLTACFTLGAMLILNAQLTISVVPLLPIFFVARRYFRYRLKIAAESVQDSRAQLSSFFQEHIPAVIQIQLLRQIRRQERKAFRLLVTNVEAEQNVIWTSGEFALFNSLFLALGVSWVLGYGGWQVVRGSLSIGGLIAFYGFVAQIYEPISTAAETYARLTKARASIRQVQTILELRPSVKSGSAATSLVEDDSSDLDLESLTFGYGRHQMVIRISNLRIGSGERVAITGENGAGKSTLGRLIMRIYDVESGMVRIGGRDIRTIRLESLRQQICYLPREPVLFDTSLGENLRLGKVDGTREEMIRVMELVGLSEITRRQPLGLDLCIGPGGCQLSGGQRQRLAVARALLSRPGILIFDEATSGLDQPSEEQLLANVRGYLPKTTVLMITHRITTIRKFERLLVLSDGQVKYDGCPDEFLARYSTGSLELLPLRTTTEVNLSFPPLNSVQTD